MDNEGCCFVRSNTPRLSGHVIDILAVLATLFGLATSLGLGAQQAASGINHVFGINVDGTRIHIQRSEQYPMVIQNKRFRVEGNKF